MTGSGNISSTKTIAIQQQLQSDVVPEKSARFGIRNLIPTSPKQWILLAKAFTSSKPSQILLQARAISSLPSAKAKTHIPRSNALSAGSKNEALQQLKQRGSAQPHRPAPPPVKSQVTTNQAHATTTNKASNTPASNKSTSIKDLSSNELSQFINELKIGDDEIEQLANDPDVQAYSKRHQAKNKLSARKGEALPTKEQAPKLSAKTKSRSVDITPDSLRRLRAENDHRKTNLQKAIDDLPEPPKEKPKEPGTRSNTLMDATTKLLMLRDTSFKGLNTYIRQTTDVKDLVETRSAILNLAINRQISSMEFSLLQDQLPGQLQKIASRDPSQADRIKPRRSKTVLSGSG